jgi:hypothetical protein
MNSNWGLVDPLDQRIRDKRRKREALAERAIGAFRAWMTEQGIDPASPIEENEARQRQVT